MVNQITKLPDEDVAVLQVWTDHLWPEVVTDLLTTNNGGVPGINLYDEDGKHLETIHFTDYENWTLVTYMVERQEIIVTLIK